MYATRGTDWAAVAATIRGAHVGWCLAVVFVSVCCHVLRSQRWRVLLRPVGEVALWPTVAATFIGFGANATLPLRLGEIIRPAFLSRRTGMPIGPTISSIVIERIFDGILVVGCLLAVALSFDVDEYLRLGAITLGWVMGGGLVVLVLAQRKPATAERLIRRMVGALPERLGEPVWAIARGFLHGLDALGDLRIVATVLLYSVVLWGLITLTYTLSFLALDVQVPLFLGSLVTVVIVAAAVMLPQAPGFLGTWQIGCVWAIERALHGSHDVAVGFAFLTWALQMTVNIGVALVAIAVEGVSFRELAQESRTELPQV